jgi:dihydrofolate reductase
MTKGVDIELICAMDKNRVIGKDGKMPWHIPEELQTFKTITVGGNIIMGRKTLESIGRALPDRVNICVSKSLESRTERWDDGNRVMVGIQPENSDTPVPVVVTP